MRFADWNGTGDIDAHDLTTSIAIDAAERHDEDPSDNSRIRAAQGVGCATSIVMAVSLAIALAALFCAFF